MIEYELSLEFWLCWPLNDRVTLFHLRLHDIDEDVCVCNASFILLELYLLLDGLEKFTDALNDVPGRAFGSCVWDHFTEKFLVWKKSVLPFSPVWSLE